MGRGGYRGGIYGPPPPVMGTPPPRQQMHHQKFSVTHQTFDFIHVSKFSVCKSMQFFHFIYLCCLLFTTQFLFCKLIFKLFAKHLIIITLFRFCVALSQSVDH